MLNNKMADEKPQERQLGLGFIQTNMKTGDRVRVGGPTAKELEQIATQKGTLSTGTRHPVDCDDGPQEIPVHNSVDWDNVQKYRGFYTQVLHSGISVSGAGIFTNADYKRELLQKCFPGQFSPGNQDLSTLQDAQIGHIFLQLFNYSEQIVKYS